MHELLRSEYDLDIREVLDHVQSYPTRSVFRVATSDGTVAVKVDRQPPPREAVGSEAVHHDVALRLPEHLPRLRPTTSGSFAVHRPGLRVTVSEDIPGGPPPDTVETWAALGSILARLHALTPVSRPFAIPVHAAIEELATQSAAYGFGAEFRALLPRAADIDVGATATIHGEVNLSNCLARADGTIVLIDWDQAGYGRTALDLGYPLVCVFLTEDLDWRSPMAAAFYKAYQKHRPLPDAEQILAAALFHAMRYMWFHNVDRRWRRVQHAAMNRAALMSVLSPAQTSR
ncbi:MAG: phosphotransferase [Lapillicoccus sp.]